MTKAEAAVSASVELALAGQLEQDEAIERAWAIWASLSSGERKEADRLWEEAERLLLLPDKEAD